MPFDLNLNALKLEIPKIDYDYGPEGLLNLHVPAALERCCWKSRIWILFNSVWAESFP